VFLAVPISTLARAADEVEGGWRCTDTGVVAYEDRRVRDGDYIPMGPGMLAENGIVGLANFEIFRKK